MSVPRDRARGAGFAIAAARKESKDRIWHCPEAAVAVAAVSSRMESGRPHHTLEGAWMTHSGPLRGRA
jgi:hypothetical protein